MTARLKILSLIPPFFMTLIAQNVSSVDSALQEINSLYNAARYVDAELESRRLREEPALTDSAKVLIEKWIAFSLIAQGKTSSARERFNSLLLIDPDFDLDPVLTSPKILSVFNDAKVKYLSWKKSQPDTLRTDAVGGAYAVSYRAVAFPGWEQLHQGRTTSGAIFLGAGIATLGGGIVFEIFRANAREEYLKATISSEIKSKYDSYNFYRSAEIYSFISFGIIYVASELDVFSNTDSSPLSVHSSHDPHIGQSITFTVKF